MKPRPVFLAILATLAAFALAGCHSIDPNLVKAMAGDNAHIRARVTSLYGTIEFERVMDFPPAAPPAAKVEKPAEPEEPAAPLKERKNSRKPKPTDAPAP